MAGILKSSGGMLVIVVFLVSMSLTTLASFLVTGEVWELFLAAVFNVLATVAKYMSKYDVVGFASFGVSLVADLHLIPAVFLALSKGLGGVITMSTAAGDPVATAVYGLAVGGTVANIISVALMIYRTSQR